MSLDVAVIDWQCKDDCCQVAHVIGDAAHYAHRHDESHTWRVKVDKDTAFQRASAEHIPEAIRSVLCPASIARNPVVSTHWMQ